MGFPFNLFSVEWTAHLDARGGHAGAVAEWLAELADPLPAVREEAFEQLEEALASGARLAPVAPHAVEPLVKLTESESSKGRALAAILLANLALRARTRPGAPATELLEQLQLERSSLQTLATRHGASTPLGAALRGLLTVLGAPACPPAFVEQLAQVESLVLEADAKDEAPPPTPAQVAQWLIEVKAGGAHALGLAERAFAVDPKGALALLEADAGPATTAVHQAHRAVLQARCQHALGQPIEPAPGRWSLAAQALLLDAAERHCLAAPAVGLALLQLVTEPAHSVRRRAVAARVQHAAGDVAGAWELVDALAQQWLEPARAGGVNQSLGRAELLGLLRLFGSPAAAARVSEVTAAPSPEVALPEGELL